MAVDKLVDSTQLDSDLTSVANAIRTKGGTSAQMAFPAGFVSAVQAIPTGITPTGTKQISIAQNGTTTEDVAAYANAEITVDVQGGGGGINILDVNEPSGAFVSDYSGESGVIKPSALRGRVAVTSVHLTAAKHLSSYAVSECTALEVLVGEQLKSIANYGIYSNPALAAVDMLGGNGTYDRIYNNGFSRCGALKTLIIRAPYCITLGGGLDGAFGSSGDGGTLYVPQATITEYTQATNWSTILSYANNQILPIEGSIYETQYADGTPIT